MKTDVLARVVMLIVAAAMVAVVLIAAVCSAGCAPNQTAAKLTSDAAVIAAQAKVDQAKADAAPLAHPVTSANSAVSTIRGSLLAVTIVAAVLLAVSVGLWFTPLSFVSKIAVPITSTVAVLSAAEVIALPFFPWVLFAALAVFVGLFVYEWIRLGTPAKAIKAIEADFGVTTSITADLQSVASKAPAVSAALTDAAKAVGNVLHVATPAGMT